jgi:hypothetical protein
MSYYIDPSPKEPSLPDEDLASKANAEAIYSTDAEKSREAFEKQMKEELNHPVQQKVLEACRSRRNLLCCILAVGFLCIVFWEWTVSREIYEVWFPKCPWVPFIGLVAVALYVSACLNESLPAFSLSRTPDKDEQKSEAHTNNMYDRKNWREKAKNWLFSPVTGCIIGTLFLIGIYLSSRKRVELLEGAGELPGASFQVYLPVILYAIEIILGIFAFFLIVITWVLFRMYRRRKQLSRVRDLEISLRQSAIKRYMNYAAQIARYNEWAIQNKQPQIPVIPPNQKLRELLDNELEWNSIKVGGEKPTDSVRALPAPSESGRSTPRVIAPDTNLSTLKENEEGDRVNDLINLVDEVVSRENRSL